MADEALVRQIAERTYPAEWPHGGELWKHYKGATVLVICLAVEEASGTPVVVYQHKDDGTRWTRPVAVWLKQVHTDGGPVPRFTKEAA